METSISASNTLLNHILFLHTFCLIVEQNFINWLLSSSFDLFEQQIYSRL